MSEPENFLSRWSRRKLDAEPEENPSARPREGGDPEPPKDTPASAALDSRLRGNERGQSADDSKEPPAFDLTTLPSLESITAETDIRLFLQKGVPAQLTRAALRRAWAADPNIRDFIGIAENQYDFATGKDLPGFGALDASADDIRKMVAEVSGDGPKPPPEPETNAAPDLEPVEESGQAEVGGGSGQPPQPQDIAAAPQEESTPQGSPDGPAQSIVQSNKVDFAVQQNNPDSEYEPLPPRRPHGRALPQ